MTVAVLDRSTISAEWHPPLVFTGGEAGRLRGIIYSRDTGYNPRHRGKTATTPEVKLENQFVIAK